MTYDELLMLSFVRGWTPLTKLLQNYTPNHLFVNDKNTIFFIVPKNAIGPNFCFDLDQTDCVYSLGIETYTAKFEIFP